METPASAQSLRILCLDGGGIKGYTTLLILKRIFRTIQQAGGMTEEPKPCEIFDFIVGTSTGGLIAIMLGRLNMSIDSCISYYEQVGKKVFDRKPLGGRSGKAIKGLLNSPFYDIEALQTQVKFVMKEQNFNEAEPFRPNEVSTCKVMVCVTRTKIGKPDVLRSYLCNHPTQENYDCSVWEAASATSAAPIYFKAVKFAKGGERWCDGGLHRNNPVNEALAELLREESWKDKPLGCLLSLGTGVPKLSGVSGNLAKFLLGSVNIMNDSEAIADAFAQSAQGQELINSRRYFRFSVPQGMHELQMDEVNETETMKALTSEYLRKFSSGNDVEQCAKSLLYPDETLEERVTLRPSMLPYETCAQFVQRPQYSSILQAFFKPGLDDQLRFVLWGLGGVGKTQIALKFSLSMRCRLSVYWVRADSYSNFLSDFARILDLVDSLQCEEAKDKDLIAAVKKVTLRLNKDPNSWLLVLDNADDWESFMGIVANDSAILTYLPRRGRILLTTRDPRFLGSFTAATHGLNVKPMTNTEAKELLLKSVPKHLTRNSSDAIAVELLEELANLPLAIAQAAANIGDQQISLAEYNVAYRSKRDRIILLENPTYDFQTSDPRTSVQSIQVTWEMAFERLEQKHPYSAACLNYMGFFSCRSIPGFLIRKLPEFESMNSKSFRGVIKHLLHLSMIEEITSDDLDEYFLHPVVHARISSRMTTEKRWRYLEGCVDMMASIFPEYPEEKDDLRHLQCRYLRSHAIAQIEIGESIDFRSRGLARLLQLVAAHLRSDGITSYALILAELSVSIGEHVWGSGSFSTFKVTNELLACLNANVKYQEALEKSGVALEAIEAEGNRGIIDAQELLDAKARVLIQRGVALHHLHMHEEVEKNEIELLNGGSTMAKQQYNITTARHSIANSLNNQGKFKRAEKLNSELLSSIDAGEAGIEVSSRNHRHMISLRAHILRDKEKGSASEEAVVLTAIEKNEILQIYKHVYEDYLATNGIDDIDTWKALNNLLGEYKMREDSHASFSILEPALNMIMANDLQMEGQILETFGYTLARALELTQDLHAHATLNSANKADILEKLLFNTLDFLKADFEKIITDASVMNYVAVFWHRKGYWEDAERLHRHALSLPCTERSGVFDVIHYNIMLAIARQGRKKEALSYRQQHLDEIAHNEVKNGDLDFRLERDRLDQEIYHRAQDMIRRGYLDADGDAWLAENKAAIARAKLIYGPLTGPNTTPAHRF